MIPLGVPLSFLAPAQSVQTVPGASGTSAEFVILLLLTFLFLAVLAGAVIIVWRRKRRKAEPNCGKCGYTVTGLTTFICPECGSDLRQVGINRAITITKRKSPPLNSPISHAPTARTLTVMFSDIHNFTASSAASHRFAASNLARRHQDTLAPIAKQRNGKIVKTLGDGLLLTFESATDAVCAGLDMQAAVTLANGASFDESTQLAIRIGIATGEVVSSDGDVFGDPVNLASRIQQLAAPGSVWFAESTFATFNRNEIGYEDLGEKELKGIRVPVRVYLAKKR